MRRILPDNQINSRIQTNSVLGLIFGLLISVLYFVFREVLDNRIKSEDELKYYTLPILGTIPDFNINNNSKKSKRKKK